MGERGSSKLKLLDKYVGIPLIFLLGLLRKRNRSRMENPERIVIVMIAAIGDTILLSSVIKELRREYPHANISLICSKGNLLAAKNNPDVDNIIDVDMGKISQSLFMLRKLPKADWLLDFGPWARFNALLSFVIKAEIKIGFKRTKMFRHYIYDRFVEHSDELHELENYRSLLKIIPCRLYHEHPVFKIKEESKKVVKDLLQPNSQYIVFHMFASGSHKEKKEWPMRLWEELAQQLMSRGYNIILTGGKEDIERAEAVVQRLRPLQEHDCLSVAGRLSLEETAAVISESILMITVNTGIMHLAAAIDTSIIALHGPTSPKRWGPVSNKAVVLTPRVQCDKLLSLGFEEHHCSIQDGCISTIRVEDVVYHVEKGESFAISGGVF
ncbi:glycosyltransferase family 9 protein [Robertmurraya massiliosenegalensis]|uniref:glycosyltransferase family 9 protein n=2 Tax=Robertmurraya massiliosenegalensis TaxID=1287657 RepID=UPI0002D2D3F5|nr:glycosyltransferase family 9 protein [Robertmurraya massiliosenegalensis]